MINVKEVFINRLLKQGYSEIVSNYDYSQNEHKTYVLSDNLLSVSHTNHTQGLTPKDIFNIKHLLLNCFDDLGIPYKFEDKKEIFYVISLKLDSKKFLSYGTETYGEISWFGDLRLIEDANN